jgi:hypothetical protein
MRVHFLPTYPDPAFFKNYQNFVRKKITLVCASSSKNILTCRKAIILGIKSKWEKILKKLMLIFSKNKVIFLTTKSGSSNSYEYGFYRLESTTHI